jgi:putative transposase
MSKERRRSMVETNHSELSISRQCVLLGISRGSLYYTPKGESDLNLKLMRKIDKQYLKTPWYGSRQMVRHLKRAGYLGAASSNRFTSATLNTVGSFCGARSGC